MYSNSLIEELRETINDYEQLSNEELKMRLDSIQNQADDEAFEYSHKVLKEVLDKISRETSLMPKAILKNYINYNYAGNLEDN